MLKKLVFIVCFTFWLVPKVSAQQDFLNAMRITSVFYDLNYDFNYIFRGLMDKIVGKISEVC